MVELNIDERERFSISLIYTKFSILVVIETEITRIRIDGIRTFTDNYACNSNQSSGRKNENN